MGEGTVQEKKSALDAANKEVTDTYSAKNSAQQALQAANVAKVNADTAVLDAEEKRKTAEAEHADAVNNHDTESAFLSSNNQLLGDVITLLRTIVSPTSSPT